MSKHHIQYINLYGENQLAEATPVPILNIENGEFNGDIAYEYPEETEEVELEYPMHVYTWEETGGKKVIKLDDDKLRETYKEPDDAAKITELQLAMIEIAEIVSEMSMGLI